jgi:hypothetical protein
MAYSRAMTDPLHLDMPKDPFDGEPPSDVAEVDTPITKTTLLELGRDSRRYNAWGIAFFVIAATIGCVLVVVSYVLTVAAVDALNAAKDPEWMLVLLVVRGVFFGGLSIALLYGLLTISTAFIDQGARFRKRLYSAHMINYALREFHGELQSGAVKLKQVVEVFNAWNHSVESAFSDLRFQKKIHDVSLGSDRLGLTLKQPEKQPKPPKD